jgi:hypothetical protein
MNSNSIFPVVAKVLIGLPVAGFALGLLLQFCIPGCHCDEGAGCHSCMGLEDFIAFLTFGGFVGAILGVFATVGVAILLGVSSAFSGSPSAPETSEPHQQRDRPSHARTEGGADE